MSFYYTEKIVRYVQTKTPLYQEIETISSKYTLNGENAVINDRYIVPGINTISVNIEESFLKMKSSNDFDSDLLVFENINPSISLLNNKDKIINKGNKNKKSVSIITNNELVLNYCYLNNVNINTFSSLVNNYNNKYEYLNNENDEKNFNKVENLLTKYKKNKNICFLNNNYDICNKNNKFIVDSTVTLNNTNLLEIKSVLESGYIIYITEDVKLENFIILLNIIKNNNLSVIFLSELISEER